MPDEPPTGPPVGVDVGLTCWAATSDGRIFTRPKNEESAERRLKRMQRKLARQVKGSGRRKDTVQRLARMHERLFNIRQEARHSMTASITGRHEDAANRPAAICLEDLNVAGMHKNHRLARHLSQAGLTEISRQIEYKASWLGIITHKADRWFPSTKRCNRCGHTKRDMSLGERTYVCEECGFEIHRDVHAARNILDECMKKANTPGPGEVKAHG